MKTPVEDWAEATATAPKARTADFFMVGDEDDKRKRDVDEKLRKMLLIRHFMELRVN